MSIPRIMQKLNDKDMGIRVEGNSISIYKYKSPMDEFIVYINDEKVDDMELVVNGRFKLHDLQWTLNLINEIRFMFRSPVKVMDDDSHSTILADDEEDLERKTIIHPDENELETEDIKLIHDYKAWTRQDEQFLKDNYDTMSIGILARRLGRTRSATINRINKLNLRKKPKELKNQSKTWTKDDDKFLKNNYGKLINEEIAKRLGRTEKAIQLRVSKMGLRKNKSRKWTKEEDEFLKSNYGKLINKEIAKKLGRTEKAIQLRANGMDIHDGSFGKSWTKREEKFLKDNHEDKIVSEIATILGRTESSIVNKLYKMGLSGLRSNDPRKTWKEEEINFLKENYTEMTAEEISNTLGRSDKGVVAKANELGLRKNIRWKKEEIQFLRENYDSMTATEIAHRLNRTTSSVSNQITELGLSSKMDKIKWTEEEEEFIIENMNEMTHREKAEKLGRTKAAVEKRIHDLRQQGRIK